MLVGVLISIMISIVVGVSLVPTIVDSVNTAKETPNAPTGLSGLLDVLIYVYVAVILLGAVAWINLKWFGSLILESISVITSLSRGSLSRMRYGNPELAGTLCSGQV